MLLRSWVARPRSQTPLAARLVPSCWAVCPANPCQRS